MKHRYMFIAIILSMVACAPAPTTPSTISTKPAESEPVQDLTHLEPETTVVDPTIASLNRNIEIDRKANERKTVCYSACTSENYQRVSGWDHFRTVREEAKVHCRPTSKPMQTVYTSQEEIVMNNSTGRYEVRPKQYNSLNINPSWSCDSDATEEMRDIAANWMYKTPPKYSQKNCESIKYSPAFVGVDLDSCLRWVKLVSESE